MTGELDTPRDCYDVGMSYSLGWYGGTPYSISEMMQSVRRQEGALQMWQVVALLEGHAAGTAAHGEPLPRSPYSLADYGVPTGEEIPY